MKRKKTRFNKINKKAVSLITAAVMFVSSLPVSDMLDVTKKAYNGIVAWAAENQTYDLSDKYDSNNNSYNLTSQEDFVTYSLAYQQSPSEYYDKNITLNFQQITELSDFVSIGTSEYPFKGAIYISSTNDNGLILDKALFDYAYDSCKIQDLNNKTAKPITLSRQDGGSGVLFANNVIHDDANTDGGNIQIIAESIALDENESNGTFSGFIGTLGEGAKLDLTVTNNTGSTEIIGSGDTGLICGTMGENSSLTVTVGSGTNNSYSVTSSGGNAGGLVGSMENGSTLTVNSDVTTSGTITAESGYAGGLVGYAENAVVEFSISDTVTVNETVSGSLGSGGVFGYYKNGNTFNITNYNVNCTLNGGNAGGIFGKLQNNGGTVTINSTNKITANGYGSNYGGLIGSYSAVNSSDTLKISGLIVNVTKSGTATNYGGIIGSTDSNAYVKCSGVKVTAKGCNSGVTSFGGFIGSNGGGMLDVEDFTVIQADGNNAFLGGGVVGNMTAGVLQLSGTTDLSATKCDVSTGGKGKYGQIVGVRGNQTLIYALPDWQLIRSTVAVEADDIGTWGEVLRFSDNFDKDKVLTVDNDAHTVTVKEIEVTDTNTNAVTVSSVEEFAIVALNLKAKINANNNNNALKFSNTDSLKNVDANATLNMTLTNDIDLTGTGITGLYRDDGCNAQGANGTYNFSGSIIGVKNSNGEYPTITLAAGEPYGYRKNVDTDSLEPVTNDSAGNGRIYCHRYSGLISKINGESTLSNFNVTGSINIQVRCNNDMYVGGIAAQSVTNKNITFENVSTDVKIGIICKEGINLRCGGLVGELYDSQNVIKIKGCNISPEITCDNNQTNKVYIGGLIGNILSKPKFSITVEETEVNAKINNSETNKNVTAGGLIANIVGYVGNSTNRKITLDDVTLNGAEALNCNSGALLGSTWCNVDVVFGGENGGLNINNCAVSGNSNFAGLVTNGSGYWKVNKVDIKGITVTGESGAESFGMFVNKGYTTYNSDNRALYLEFTDKNAYKISGDTISLANSSPKFDEILVYANSSTSSIAADGNCAVVSIRTSDPDGDGKPKVIMDGENCNTYQNQTIYANDNTDKKFNSYVRYYYNLDYIRGKSNKNDAEKLLLWSVNRYAHESLKQYFVSDFISTTSEDDSVTVSTITSGDYDMIGYSYYPIDISDTVNIEGSSVFTFYNNEFDTSELTGDSKRITYATDTEKNYKKQTQHYLMQNGLFRNCSGSLTVNNVTFSGNVSKAFKDSTEIKDSGVLVCGTITGATDSPAKVECNNIILDGIFVNDADTAEINVTYAPLLINKVNHDVKLTVNGISTTDAYNTEDGISSKIAAGCLIGNVGVSDYNNANNIKLVFNSIKLDSRKKRFSDDGINTSFDTAYNTKNSIFKNATILNAFSYPEGKNCSAIYNYKHSEDWDDDGNALHNVTYGKEITTTIQYKENGVSLERNYLNSQYFTDPSDPENTTDPYNFDNGYFLPYVKDKFGTDSSNKNFYEIKVNVASPNLDKGCGTYNDPYIISKANQFMLVADILGGVDTFSDGTVINYRENNYNTWCDEKTDTDHCMYVWDSENNSFYPPETDSGGIVKDVLGNPIPDTTKDPVDLSTIKDALSTAYYKLNDDITLGASFKGLGAETPFMGVIDGNEKTIINESTNPLIYNSTGSVVKDLTVKVTADFTSTFQNVTANTIYATDGSGSTPFYGGIFGIVNGGDNIIDKVSVTIENAATISPSGTNPGNVAVGGYVGVVRYGGVIFRNMSDAAKPDFSQNIKFGDVSNGSVYLYLNPIIGRVIDGFAVTESDSYKPREEQVTMQNGTKNYSIADINRITTNKISISDAKIISVPDGQSLFLMGCIAMSGAGSANTSNNQYQTTYSYGTGKMVRGAEYDHIGEDTTTDDYNLAKIDNYKNTSIPYIISRYTNNTTSARKLTTDTFSIELTGAENYILPDGFRGIGSMNNSSDNLEMTLSGFDGKGQTVEMNSNFHAYNINTAGYDKYYTVNNNNINNQNVGLGLFNKLVLSDSSEIKDLTLKGNVTVTIYESESQTNRMENASASMCAGMLAGISMTHTFTVNNVKLLNATVDTMNISGGLIGIIRNGENKTFTANSVSADNLSVAGGQCAGGLVGYVYGFTCNINKDENQNSEFMINSISADSTSGTWNNSYQGCGGLFGALHKSTVDINNISVEKSTAEGSKGEITSKTDTAFTGGLIGCGVDKDNGRTINITNATVRNIDIKHNGSTTGTYVAYFGGIIGGVKKADGTTINLSNINVIGDKTNGNTILGRTEAGGLIGLQLGEMTADNCTVENYNMQTIINASTEGVGGFIAKSESKSGTEQKAVLKNSKISNCKIQTDYGNKMPAGIIVGMTHNKIQFSGYNILVNNVQLTKTDGTSAMEQTGRVGNIAGYANSDSAVKLVGVCWQNKESDIIVDKDIGYGSGTTYVIYSDYTGACLSEPNKNVSDVNNTNNVTEYGVSPYATINPKAAIDGTNFLTSDGVSGKTTVESILADTARYKNVSADRATFAKYTDKLSTFNDEMVTSLTENFPVLVVNDSNKANVTEMINSYIHLLTNDTSIDKYSDAENDKYNIDISKYRMENGSDTFTKVTDEDDKPTLKLEGSVFYMTDLDYDSNHTQFTLIDVQYYAPNDTTKVAYHLYIPVLVEKMLKFDFKAEILTGTTYNVDAYKDHKIVMESYGTPVTMHVSYSYKRTLSEWQTAIDLGENLLGNYGKTVLLTSGNQNHLPPNTNLVLVDRNNGDRAYYSTMNEAFTSADNKLSFDKFKTADESTSFKPVSLLELLSLSAEISAAEDNENGKYIVCESTDANAAVKVGETYYKLKPEESTETAYSITISAKDSTVTDSTILPVEEDYYISFFTPGNTNAEMVDITAKSATKLDDTGMKTPSHITSSNVPAQMILGDLYDQSFEFEATNSTEVMSETNNTLEATLKTTITIKEANQAVIKSYLSDDNIKVYHGFVIDLQRTDSSGTEKGVKGDPFVSGTYMINSTYYNISETCSASSIELTAVKSGETVDISKMLQTSDSGVMIQCNNLKINYNTAGIIEQFPIRPDGNNSYGVKMSAASNLAYASENILHSNISETKTDDKYKYYRQGDVTVAKLNYNIPTGTADADEFSKLGINGNVSPEDITAVGYYDVSELSEEDLNNAKKVSVELSLFQKQNDGTYEPVDDMNKYLDNISLYKSDNSAVNAAVSGNSCSYVFDKNDLDLENSIFTIRSGYTVKTGGEFEGNDLIYSNYKVIMTVHLLDENEDIITNSGCYDYIIYTNAKIYTEFLKTAG